MPLPLLWGLFPQVKSPSQLYRYLFFFFSLTQPF